MEKFALLNLLKAIDGLQRNNSAENSSPETGREVATQPPAAPEPPQTADMPNFMYETLLRHEAISNRLKNKR